jgi:hypothetical protein
VTERRERRRKQILDDVTSTRSSRKLKEGELDRTLWRTSFARVYSSVVRQNTERMNIILLFSKTLLCKISHIRERLPCELTHKPWLTLRSLILKAAPFLVQIPSVPSYHYPFYRHTYHVLRSYA